MSDETCDFEVVEIIVQGLVVGFSEGVASDLEIRIINGEADLEKDEPEILLSFGLREQIANDMQSFTSSLGDVMMSARDRNIWLRHAAQMESTAAYIRGVVATAIDEPADE